MSQSAGILFITHPNVPKLYGSPQLTCVKYPSYWPVSLTVTDYRRHHQTFLSVCEINLEALAFGSDHP